MMKEYGYKYPPIFMGIVGKITNFYGLNPENMVAMQFEYFIETDANRRLQNYYSWTDLIYFTEYIDEYMEIKEENNALSFDKFVWEALNKKPPRRDDEESTWQATVEYLRRANLECYTEDLSKLFDAEGNPLVSNDVLKPLTEYAKVIWNGQISTKGSNYNDTDRRIRKDVLYKK